MKPGLQRIEATLDQLGIQPKLEDFASEDPAGEGVVAPAENSKRGTQSRSVSSRSKPQSKTHTIKPFPLPKGNVELSHAQGLDASSTARNASAAPAPPLTAPTDGSSSPALPRSQMPIISSHRHAANPNLAIGLLKEIETLVRTWQTELEEIVQQIHALYQEGPIVEGWLESQSSGGQHITPPVDMSLLRHADVEYLMAFIEQLCQAGQTAGGDASRTDYRLCGLDPDGKVWSRPCPPEQVAYVSLAIARYQKLRTLMAKKETLESRLMGLVQTLTMMHGQLRD